MRFDSERYYKESGAVPVTGALLAIAGGTVATIVLSVVYALIDYYNPIIYVTFIGAGVLGLGTGMGVTFGAKMGKVRNQSFLTILGVAVGLLALYVTWVFYLWIYFSYTVLIFSPNDMFFWMQFFGEKGLWELMGGWTPTGWTLYSFWILEAIIIFVPAVVTARGSGDPFCEACDRWIDEHEDVALLESGDHQTLKDELEEERYAILDTLRAGEIDPANALHLNLHACTSCRESNYLSINHIVVTENKKGETDTESNEVLKNLTIPRSLVERLLSDTIQATEMEPEPADEFGEEPHDG